MRVGRGGDGKRLTPMTPIHTDQDGLVYCLRMEMPGLLVEAFDGDEELLAWMGTLQESWQRYIAKWVMEPKSDEAKQRRCEGMAERLLMTMEGERELPPMLAQRLRGRRDAMAGWEAMSLNRRRYFLMPYFGAKGDAARETQIVRLVEACVAKGVRLRGKQG